MDWCNFSTAFSAVEGQANFCACVFLYVCKNAQIQFAILMALMRRCTYAQVEDRLGLESPISAWRSSCSKLAKVHANGQDNLILRCIPLIIDVKKMQKFKLYVAIWLFPCVCFIHLLLCAPTDKLLLCFCSLLSMAISICCSPRAPRLTKHHHTKQIHLLPYETIKQNVLRRKNYV